MHRARPRSGVIATFVLLALTVAEIAEAQSSTRRSSARSVGRSTLSRRTASGGSFPSWEREVEADERNPLPEGRPGRFVPEWTLDVGADPRGVAELAGGEWVVALADGGIRIVDADGKVRHEADAGGAVALPPRVAGTRVLVAAGGRLVAISREGVTWRSEDGPAIVREPAVVDDAAFIVREGGTVEALSLKDGSRAWTAAAGGAVTAGPSASSRLVVVGVSGALAAFDVATGAEAWRAPLGEAVDSVLVTETSVHAAGRGPSGRTKDVTPVVVSWSLRGRDARPAGSPWRLRVGGTCTADPMLVDELVAFACADGYVRAVERGKGVGGWRTDLPSASTESPQLTGGRLDVAIPQSRHLVALQADNGAVVGWVTLPDEDETFVGPAAVSAGLTATTTTFGRLIGWRWEWQEAPEDDDEEGYRRPGEDPASGRARGTNAISVNP